MSSHINTGTITIVSDRGLEYINGRATKVIAEMITVSGDGYVDGIMMAECGPDEWAVWFTSGRKSAYLECSNGRYVSSLSEAINAYATRYGTM